MAGSLKIDRMELADTGNPNKLAELVIDQLKTQLNNLLPIPIDEVATSCGIEAFHELSTDSFEGGLIQNEEKTRGYILVKSGSRQDRRRFTVAHELGHFINPYHVAPEGADRLLCTKLDMNLDDTATRDPRLNMEAQANEFAANILMPEKPLRAISMLWGSPQIQSILDLQTTCNVSKEAAARRYLDLHGEPSAIVFSKDGKVRYSLCRGGFPTLAISKNQPIHRKTLTAIFRDRPGTISEQEEADSHLWLNDSDAVNWDLWEELLVQQDGYRMTLLLAEKNSRAEDDRLEERWTPRFHYK